MTAGNPLLQKSYILHYRAITDLKFKVLQKPVGLQGPKCVEWTLDLPTGLKRAKLKMVIKIKRNFSEKVSSLLKMSSLGGGGGSCLTTLSYPPIILYIPFKFARLKQLPSQCLHTRNCIFLQHIVEIMRA